MTAAPQTDFAPTRSATLAGYPVTTAGPNCQANLICGDSLEIMPALGPVDHVITDPPYEAIMHASKTTRERNGRRAMRTDGRADLDAVNFAAIDDTRAQAAQICVDAATGWFLAFCTPEGVAPWRDAIEAAGAKYKRACVWVKPDSAPQFNGQGPAMGAESFVAAWCGPGYSRWNAGGKRGVYTHNTNPRDRDGRHPTEKPLRLMAELIADFTNAGDLVVDPFMGSGTTGVACAQAGRRFIGIERDPAYFEVACERIREAYRQPRLFDDAAPKPTQTRFDLDAAKPESGA